VKCSGTHPNPLPNFEIMEIILREDLDPSIDFYYHHQFKIYHEPYLIWDRGTWETILATCTVYRIEVNGKYAGDIILEDREMGTKFIVDLSVLPEYQAKGIGKVVLEQTKELGKKLTAFTRKETLNFFLKSGFVLTKTMKNYYHSGVNGYSITFSKPIRTLGKGS
jgi:GNAT superfamily N-acetyltransferase